MRISSDARIADHPILEVRRLLQLGQARHFNQDDVEKVLSLKKKAAKQFIQTLANEGYIVRDVEWPDDELWNNTEKGNALANASAAKPIKRATADKLYQQFLERVKLINAADEYAYKIKKVILFGSYLGDSSDVGDIDLAIELELRSDDPDTRSEMMAQRVRVAEEAGREFASTWQRLSWPTQEIFLLLKARSRAISLHYIEDDILKRPETIQKVVYPLE